MATPLKKPAKNIILTVKFEGAVIAEISGKKKESEVLKSVLIKSKEPKLELIDEIENRYVYDLSSVAQKGLKWIDFSIRTLRETSATVDCLVSHAPNASREDFDSGKVEGIRLQPISLPDYLTDLKDLVGHGLFFRGLHFPGTITPGNVSLVCICDVCANSFQIKSFHAGFSDCFYFYCSGGPHVLTVSVFADGAEKAIATGSVELETFEKTLPKCKICSGEFRYMNPFRCPHCKAPYIDFTKYPEEREEYYGNYLYGQEPQGMA